MHAGATKNWKSVIVVRLIWLSHQQGQQLELQL